MHWSGEINLSAVIGVVTLIGGLITVLMRLGSMQAVLIQLVEDAKAVAARLAVHEEHDEVLFRDLAATLNQIVGKLGGKP